MFNMLGQFFDGGRVLDLYAGSGALAIEAVSRGFDEAVLVEKDRSAQQIIQANIAMTKEPEKFQLLKMKAEQALLTLDGSFDLVLLDPPYAKEQIVSNLTSLQERLSSGARAVCETDKEVELPEKIGVLQIAKQKTYGISKITIYEK